PDATIVGPRHRPIAPPSAPRHPERPRDATAPRDTVGCPGAQRRCAVASIKLETSRLISYRSCLAARRSGLGRGLRGDDLDDEVREDVLVQSHGGLVLAERLDGRRELHGAAVDVLVEHLLD